MCTIVRIILVISRFRAYADLCTVADFRLNTDNGFDAYVKSLVNHIGKVQYVNRTYRGSAPSVLMDEWEYGSIVEKISSELPEVLRMSDRIIVMCEGRKTGELDISEATQENIMQLATMREEN